ncbi:FHA domain-containing protein [Paenibacillus sp. JTLBN-2024]
MGYLLRESDGGGSSRRIELRQQHFVIGRSEEVSRVCRALRRNIACACGIKPERRRKVLIKDLGSKNGTRLKGEEMVPYKEYPLQDGDTFVIVKGRYTFRSA